MIIKNFKQQSEEHVVGGKGTVDFTYLAEGRMLGKNKVRAFNIVSIRPGSSIGCHCHQGESEISYFLLGRGKVILDQEEHEVKAGDLGYCPSGHSHSIENTGDEDLKIIALVIYD